MAETKSGSPEALKRWVIILLAVLGLYLLVRTEIAQPTVWPALLAAALLFGVAGFLFPTQSFGDVGHIQISSSTLEERIRNRYRSEIDELSLLGFGYQFSVGQTFPVVNLVLIFPVIVLLIMWWKREVITLNAGRFLIGHAIYASRDKTTSAHPSGLGIVFQTAFEYGSVLQSTNYGSNRTRGSRFEVHRYKGLSISETWSAHQESVRAKIENGSEIDPDMSFRAYVGINN